MQFFGSNSRTHLKQLLVAPPTPRPAPSGTTLPTGRPDPAPATRTRKWSLEFFGTDWTVQLVPMPLARHFCRVGDNLGADDAGGRGSRAREVHRRLLLVVGRGCGCGKGRLVVEGWFCLGGDEFDGGGGLRAEMGPASGLGCRVGGRIGALGEDLVGGSFAVITPTDGENGDEYC